MKKKKTKPDAFLKSERHALDGIKLQPWTPDRMIAAQSLGMIYPSIGDEGWAALKRRSIYAGAVRDVALALWLCTLSDAEVLEAEARGDAEARKQSAAWAVKLHLHDANKAPFWDAFTKFMEIQNEVNQSATLPVKGDAGTDDEELGND
jgi:hypothetical protein